MVAAGGDGAAGAFGLVAEAARVALLGRLAGHKIVADAARIGRINTSEAIFGEVAALHAAKEGRTRNQLIHVDVPRLVY